MKAIAAAKPMTATDPELETLRRWAWLLGLMAGESTGPLLSDVGLKGRGESEGETGGGGRASGGVRGGRGGGGAEGRGGGRRRRGQSGFRNGEGSRWKRGGGWRSGRSSWRKGYGGEELGVAAGESHGD
ncbi:hypothetical protein GYH30_052517 [Glycine max]|nr:hypothetical protein GYH30_052517 [Glycine max]